ncbi:MAG TPA: M15 family metallopeptidase [Thermoanaerobaculia bacterium]
MPTTSYTVVDGDTFAIIATKKYKDAALARPVARFNGFTDNHNLVSGTALRLPEKPVLLPTPHGFDELIATFGDIRKFVNKEGQINAAKWEPLILATVILPFPVKLGFPPSTMLTRFRCHKLLVPAFKSVFNEIAAQGLQASIKTYDGCYNYRMKRLSGTWSTHSWGIGIDLNASTNPQGGKVKGDMDPAVVAIFRAHGFQWGGDFKGKSYDPMHFQFCTGY